MDVKEGGSSYNPWAVCVFITSKNRQVAHRFTKYEEVALANYVQKNLAAARGPVYDTVPQTQREMAAREKWASLEQLILKIQTS